jgi:hypothetical protein
MRSIPASSLCGRSVFVFLLMAVLGPSVLADPPTRPHIVVFLSDDHTAAIRRCTGRPRSKRLTWTGWPGRDDVRSGLCQLAVLRPGSRRAVDGLYPANNGAEANHSRPRADIKKLPAYFQELGYEVVSFGKVGHYAQTPEYGFDIARHFGYHEDIAIPKAIEWLRERAAKSRSVCWSAPTGRTCPGRRTAANSRRTNSRFHATHVDNPTTRAWRARYLAAVRIMDDELGMVYDAAREELGENWSSCTPATTAPSGRSASGIFTKTASAPR